MLKRHSSCRDRPGRKQSGVVLMVALIVLVAMTLAGLALIRSVDTANIIAGNLAFQQAATNSGDGGIETAITWIEGNSSSTLLYSDQPSAGYVAAGSNALSVPGRLVNESWDTYWNRVWEARAVSAAPDAAGNTVRRVIDRMCAQAAAPTAGGNCAASPVISSATGNAEEGGDIQVEAPSQVYYRITARIQGPRNTVSYVQAVISR